MKHNLSYIENAKKGDVALSQAVAAYFLFLALNSAIKNLFLIEPESVLAGIITLACVGLMLFFLFRGIRYVIKRIPNIALKSYLIFICIYLYSLIGIIFRNEPINLLLYETAPNTFLFFLPVGLCAVAVYEKDLLYKILLKWSFVVSFILLLVFIFREQVDDYGNAKYNMTFGISLILPTLLHISCFRKTKKKSLLVLFLVEVFTLIMYANRGILLSLVFYLFVIYFNSFKKQSTKTIAFIFFILSIFIFSFYYDTFIKVLTNLLTQSGLQSRTLGMLVSENLAESSERLELWEICQSMIVQKPILGWGIGGEYFEITKQYGDSISDASIHHNPHNALLQNFVHFGIFGGFLANLLCLYPILRLNRINDVTTFELVLIFTAFGIIPRLVSAAGFFVNPSVAVALFLFYKSSYKKKYENNISVLSQNRRS